MSNLNANIPYIKAFVRNAYLYSDVANNELTSCYIFGVKSILNKPLLFHCQLDNGAVFWGLPISAYVLNKQYDKLSDNENERLSLLQYWDCQSNDVSVTTFAYLQGYTVDLLARNKTWYRGTYLFTIDNYHANLNDMDVGYASDSDSKCFHIIALDNGNLAAYPNNYCRWHNLNHVDAYDKNNVPRYKANVFNMKAEYIQDDD